MRGFVAESPDCGGRFARPDGAGNLPDIGAKMRFLWRGVDRMHSLSWPVDSGQCTFQRQKFAGAR